MWPEGTRILAVRPGEGFLYPAVIRTVDGNRVTVDFDDGETSWVFPEHLHAMDVEIGDRVLVRAPIGRQYTPAQVKRLSGEKLYVEYEDGEPEWTTLGMIRIDPASWKNVYALAVKDGDWAVGDRILAQWFDGLWYPATVEELDGDRIRVNYDDGDNAWIGQVHARGIDLQVGERVLSRYQGGSTYAFGMIEELEGEDVFIRYEDGREEWTTISVVRVERESNAPPPQPDGATGGPPMQQWQVGDRVLALWAPEPFLYPAVIREMQNGQYFVNYFDGDNAWVYPNEVAPLDIREGDFVMARWRNGRQFAPATIERMNGDDVYLRYEDGREEWSTIAAVRIPIGPPPGH